jgi:hypothetical protein
MKMISRKLLSDVLGYGEVDIVDRPDEKHVWYSYRSDPEQTVRHMNIHELAHKCKEWIKNRGLGFVIKPRQVRVTWRIMYPNSDRFGYLHEHDYESDTFYGDTEAEALFAACEWGFERDK